MVTFKASNIAAEKPRQLEPLAKDWIRYAPGVGKDFRQGKYTEIIQQSPIPGGFQPRCVNNFIGALLHAYNTHVPLCLRPDEVWIAVMAAFGLYVTKHAEQMRNVFVSHEGKMRLEAKIGGGAIKNVTEEGWIELCRQLCDQIAKNTKGDVCDLATCNFSTTGPNDILVSRLMLMGTLREYFEYHMGTLCAMTEVTLEGTLDDWKLLQNKCTAIAKFGGDLARWSRALTPVIAKFVESYELASSGKPVDVDWWNIPFSRTTHGSGGETYVTGWSLVFAPFDFKTGKYQLEDDEPGFWGRVSVTKIATSAIVVPVFFHENDCSDTEAIKCDFYAGVMPPRYDPTSNIIRPTNGWVLLRKSDSEPDPRVFEWN